jgi:hypothetical protein
MMRRPGFHWSGLAVWSALLAAVMPAAMPAAETNLPPAPPAPRYQNVTACVRLRHLSPVEYFRGLLGMSPGERERALANRSPADREFLLAKLREYEALPREIREARLCQTELHWALSGLMKLAPGDRTNRLKEVSPLYRPMVENLLRQWDKVPADVQKALLEKQSFIGVYLRMQGAPAAARQEIPDKQAFDRLPPAQRTQCINSFRKFAAMTPGERIQFLKNAARWDAMRSHERQLWRELVHTLPPLPPLPPGFPPGMPPMPPGFEQGMPPLPPLPPNVTTPVIIARSTSEAR